MSVETTGKQMDEEKEREKDGGEKLGVGEQTALS